MPLPLTLLLLAAAMATAYRAPLRPALTALVAWALLVPDTLLLPGPGMAYLPANRLVLLAFAAGVLRRVRTADIWWADLRPTRVQAAFVIYAAFVFVTGIALTDEGLAVATQLRVFAQVVDQLLLFTVVLAACRASEDLTWIGRLLAGLLVAVAVIAVIERLTGWSYAQWMLSGPGHRPDLFGRFPLEVRGGSTRVRSSAQFALAFGWLAAMLFPVLLWHAGRTRRALWRLALPLVAITAVWSGSRSAVPALAIGFVMVVVGARFERSYVLLGLVAAFAAATLAAGVPALTRAYTSFEAEGSDRTRVDRLADVTTVVAEQPLRGIGVTGIKDRLGHYGADSSFLLTYVESGVLALTALVALVATAIASASAALRAPPGPHRSLGGALLATVTLGVLAAGTYDVFSVPGSYGVVWIAAAVAIALGERARPLEVGQPARGATIPVRALLVLTALGIGLLIRGTAETHAAVTYRFDAMPLSREVHEDDVLHYAGRVLGNTVCERARTAPRRVEASVRCTLRNWPWGLGEIRVEARTAEGAAAAAADLERSLRATFPALQLVSGGAPAVGRPTLASTAPAWMMLTGVLVTVLVPDPERRRTDARTLTLAASAP